MLREKQFMDLNVRDKIRHLYMNGTFITSIRYYEYKVNLYLIDSFYVEVFYNHKRDLIEKIELLKRNHSRNKFYADQIQLPNTLFS